jgi:hypothetical protein
VLVAALSMLSANGLVFAEPNDGTVSGQVVNRTAGGAAPGGASVMLVAFGRKEQAPLGQRTAQADAAGRYSFTGVDRDPNIVYLTVAQYQDVNYPSDSPFQLQDQPVAQADITVYDATSADDAIQLENLNLLVLGADQGYVQCMEMGALVNSGDRTFVTANPQDQQFAKAIKLALPSGAMSLQMQTGFADRDVIPGIGGVQVTSPIPPGRHQFAMSFQVPYTGPSIDLSLQMPYATGTYSVYVPDTGLKLDNSPLRSAGPTQMGGQSYSLYSVSNVPKATMIGGQLSNLGTAGGLAPNQLPMISLGVVLLVIGGGVLLFGGRLRLLARRPVAAAEPEQERLELVVRLAALDERFAAGEIGRIEYEHERECGKQRLRELALARREIMTAG